MSVQDEPDSLVLMSPYAKVVLSVLRLAALGLILVGMCLYASDVFLYLRDRPMSAPWRLALKGLPVLAGVILLWKARGLAEWLTKDLE